MTRKMSLLGIVGWMLAGLLFAGPVRAAEVKVLLPLGRTAYQTNERIDVSVVRSAPEGLKAGTLAMTLTRADGSTLVFTFPVKAVSGKPARATEHLRLNGWLLRPGEYTIRVAVDGASAEATIELYPHLRKSTFRTVRWGVDRGDARVYGEDSLGFNVNYGNYAGNAGAGDAVRGGVDFMQLCTMGGGHQMDMRLECDWSDPYVMNGGAARLARQGMVNRTASNCLGVHMYDEPGLTWWVDPAVGYGVQHMVPAQVRSFVSAFGREPLNYRLVKPDNPDHLAQWEHWGHWKLSFIEAAWRLGGYATEAVRDGYLAVNQHMYGWYAYGDGYYWNIGRALPVLNGHGGYDAGGGYFATSYFEISYCRDRNKPAWYMPTFDGALRSMQARLEHYLAFMTGARGVMVPFWAHYPYQWGRHPGDTNSAPGLVESNKLLQRIGPILDTMRRSRFPAALLYSMSNVLHAQAHDMKDGYSGGGHRHSVYIAYVASKLAHMPLDMISDEDILDGTAAASYKAIVLPGVQYVTPDVAAALEAYVAAGGAVLLSDDSKVRIQGATKLGPVDNSYKVAADKAWGAGRPEESGRLHSWTYLMKAARPAAKAIREKLSALGIRPVFECDREYIFPARHAAGDIEYLFAANCTHDDALPGERIQTTVATIAVPADGRPIYDAVHARPADGFVKRGGKLVASLRFGAGQMRVLARTARPIGGVRVATPIVRRDLTLARQPLSVQAAAVLVDKNGRVLSGSAPMRIRLIDPAGTVRYDLYRATEAGVVKVSLPVGANDPAGTWTVEVRELLAGTSDKATFAYAPGSQCPAVAGAVRRAMYFGDDRARIFRFFRTFHDVTVVPGTADYHKDAAERVKRILAPWDVRCTIVPAKDAAKPRTLTADEAKAWIGLVPGKATAGEGNPPAIVGFAVRGPVVLLGTPEDNPLIAFAATHGFLPYRIGKDFPGPGRGLIAWSRDSVSYGNEAVVLIGTDAAGLGEAIGTMYEAAAGLDPLVEYDLPTRGAVGLARPAGPLPAPKQAWSVLLGDHVAGVASIGGGKVAAVTGDGTLAVIDDAGRELWRRGVNGGERFFLDASADGKLIAVGSRFHLVGYDAGGRKLFDVPVASAAAAKAGIHREVAAVAVAPDGSAAAAAMRDGRVLVVSPRGRASWSHGGLTKVEYDKYLAERKAWQAGKDQRDAAMKAYREGPLAKWQAAVKAWEKADAKTRGPKPAQPKAPPSPPAPRLPKHEPYEALAFSADGKLLAAIDRGGVQWFEAGGGKALERIGGISGLAAPVRAGDDLLVGDHNATVRRVSFARRKVVSSCAVAPGAVVFAPAPGGGVLIGTETDSTVRKLKALAGKAADQTAWSHRLFGRLPKRIVAAGDKIAVAYWGGTLDVLDAGGKLVARDGLPQDITAMVWTGGKLVVGLADGCVVGLTP